MDAVIHDRVCVMRMLIFGIALLFDGLALATQPILARSPNTLNPFAVVYVQISEPVREGSRLNLLIMRKSG